MFFFQTEVVTANKLDFRPCLIKLRREYMMNLITLHIVYTTRHVKKFNMAVAGSMHILCGTEVTTIEREKMQPSFNLQQGNIYMYLLLLLLFDSAREP